MLYLALTGDVTINLNSFLNILLILVGVALGIFLILTLAKLISTLKKVSSLLDGLQEPVAKTVNQLPDLMAKIDVIAKDVQVLTEAANESVPAVLTDVQTITGTARDGVVAVGNAARSVTNGVANLFGGAAQRSNVRSQRMNDIANIAGQIIGVVRFFKDQSGKRKKKKR